MLHQKKSGSVSLNLSPTSLNMFHKSPLLFYLTYVAKVPDDTSVPVCYGLSGSLVHDCLEKYAKKELDRDEVYEYFLQGWLKKRLDVHTDVKDNVLDKGVYLDALMHGMRLVDNYEEHVCEEMISFPFTQGNSVKIGIKGIVDLQAKENGKDVIVDYKTSNSISTGKDFERQALFYNYLIMKKKDILPAKTTFHYLKLKEEKNFSFGASSLAAFEKELNEVAEKILRYGTDISHYPAGDIDDLFNSKKKACLQEVARRKIQMNTFIQYPLDAW